MNDKKILEEVYSLVRKHIDTARAESTHNHTAKLVSNFIEQEWQRRDEALAGVGDVCLSTLCTDVQEIERHRGLEIGGDETVKSLK